MGKNSAIEWTHHTFNPWWGCVKVSPACCNCYAEKWSRRFGKEFWGEGTKRRFFGETHWKEPLKWDKEAERKQTRKRVFCASMGDVFEGREDLNPWRDKLWRLIEDTKNLDWLILTKRPHNVKGMVPWLAEWPANVWIGATIENQEVADLRIPKLLEIPAKIRFVSCEPLLSYVDLSKWIKRKNDETIINWVIVGGESGLKARPMNPVWAKALRDQCVKSEIPFHFKQWGAWHPMDESINNQQKQLQFELFERNKTALVKSSKKKAGRNLDGKTWDEVPKR